MYTRCNKSTYLMFPPRKERQQLDFRILPLHFARQFANFIASSKSSFLHLKVSAKIIIYSAIKNDWCEVPWAEHDS